MDKRVCSRVKETVLDSPKIQSGFSTKGQFRLGYLELGIVLRSGSGLRNEPLSGWLCTTYRADADAAVSHRLWLHDAGPQAGLSFRNQIAPIT